MEIDVALAPPLLASLDLTQRLIVVVDVLRATSTMITAFEKGVSEIFPVESLDQAKALQSYHPSAILCGEVNSQKPLGFDFDNSPVALSEALDIKGRAMIMRTSNGTKVLSQLTSRQTGPIYMGSFLNVAALAAQISLEARSVVIACAGSDDQPCLEDTGFAGALIDTLASRDNRVELTDTAKLASALWRSYGEDTTTLLAQAHHGQELRQLGKEADIDYILHHTSSWVPCFDARSGSITLSPIAIQGV